MRLFLPLAAAALFPALLAAAPADDSGGASGKRESLFKLPSGQVAVYEGVAQMKHIVGKDIDETKFQASLIQVAREEANKNEILTVRLLTQEGGDKALVSFDDVAVRSDPSGDRGPFQLEVLNETPPELEETTSDLNGRLPIAYLPSFPVPASGSSRSDATVSVLGLVDVKLPFSLSSKSDGSQVEIVRTLNEGSKPGFTYNEQEFNVALWHEAYVVDSATGALNRLETSFAIEWKGDEGKHRIEKSLTLESKKLVPRSGPDAGAISSLAKEIDGILADFQSIKPSEGISKRIKAFEKAAKGSSLEPVTKALTARVQAFRGFFEETEDGKGFAKLLFKPAPDFKLESLDGKQVSLREASRGKVTLLSFWGVG